MSLGFGVQAFGDSIAFKSSRFAGLVGLSGFGVCDHRQERLRGLKGLRPNASQQTC